MTQTTGITYAGNEYLAVGQALMCFSIICFVWSAYATSWRKTTFILGTAALWLTMESGARGPVTWGSVALLMMIIFDLLRHRGSLKRWMRIILLGGAFFIVTFCLVATFYPIDTLIQRMEFLNRFMIDRDLGYDDLSSIGARIMYRNYALALIADNPFIGYGALSFRSLTGVLYPHNIFLDAWVELGIVGLLLVTFLLIQGLLGYWCIIGNRKVINIICATLFIFYLGMSLTSGYLYWSSLWSWVALIIVISQPQHLSQNYTVPKPSNRYHNIFRTSSTGSYAYTKRF
jgi:O-antigen ligase